MSDDSSVSSSSSSGSSSSSSSSSSEGSVVLAPRVSSENTPKVGVTVTSKGKDGDKSGENKDGEPASKDKKKSFWAQKHAVYMKGFPFRSTDTELKNFLSDLTDMKTYTRQMNADSQWAGSIVVKFNSEEGVNQALALNESVWGGTGADGTRYIKVEKQDPQKQKKRNATISKSKKGGSGVANTIFLGNLAEGTTSADVEGLLRESMRTVHFKVRLAVDKDEDSKEEGKCRGFGHVEFTDSADKEKALKLTDLTLGGRPVKVRNPSTPEKRKEREKKKKSQEKKAEKKKNRAKKWQEAKDKVPVGFKKAFAPNRGGSSSSAAGGLSKGKKRGGKRHSAHSSSDGGTGKRQRTD
jgi:RNA recognition motif-containing protein